MKFVRIIAGFDHLWAVQAQDKEVDELTILFRNWTNGEYLLDLRTSCKLAPNLCHQA